jgi:hypothetical protein
MGRCEGTTKDGTRCKVAAMGDQKMCFQHSDKCPICLERLGQGDDTSSLACGHSFHATCVYHWLDRSTTCPMCRFQVKSMTMEVEHDPVLDDVWSTIPGLLRELVNDGTLLLSDRVRIGAVFTITNIESGQIIRTSNFT